MSVPGIRLALMRALAIVLLLATAAQLAAAQRERAFRLLTTYSTADHDAGSQNFCVTESADGVIYIGNLAGLLEYDGAWWRLIKIGDELPAVALSPLSDGRVAVGAVGDFGYLARDAAGVMQYQSLLSKLKLEDRAIQRVYKIYQTQEGVIFVTHTSILRWSGSTVTVLEPLPEEAGRSFPMNGTVWIKLPTGMHQLVGGRLQPVAGGEVFGKETRPSVVLPWTNGQQLVVLRTKGIFTFDGRSLTPFAPEASEMVKRDYAMSGHRLSDGRAAIALYRSGVILLRPDGEIDEVIDRSVGLPEFDISGSFIARDGSLLLAMENGITRVDVSSALSIIDSRGGMRGGAQAAARHGGVLYVGTTGGLYSVRSSTGGPRASDTGNEIVTRVAPGEIESSWALLSLGDELLVGGGDKIAVLGSDGALRTIEGTKDLITYTFRQSAIDRDLVYVGLDDGFGTLRRRNGTWTWEGRTEGVKSKPSVRNIVEERDGSLWFGTTYHGAIHAKVISRPGEKLRLETKESTDDEVGVFRVAGRTVFTAGAPHLLHFDSKTQRFVADPLLGRLGNGSTPFFVVEDSRKNIWLNTRPVGVAVRNAKGEYALDDRVLVDMPGRDVQMIYPDVDDVVWFGTEKGLVRYDARSARIESPPRMPLVRQVTVNGNALKASNGRFEIKHGAGRIRFEISPVSYEPGLSYQYRLHPNESGWSSWTNEPFTEFTNLWENDYRIEIRTRNVRNKVSPIQTWKFSILPPWYRTSWAYALWIALLLLLVAGVSKIRTRSLRGRASMLEQRVAEQTHELIEKNQALEHANSRLEQLSFDDALTGIPNRRHFEETLRTEWNRAWRANTTLSFVLMDVDHFKQLNDTRGHQVGDECLRQIGTFLEKSLKRSGDFAARYGGEEFALVLPTTDLEGACHIAEQLRAGIEALNIPNTGSPFRIMTASFGVASVRPNDLSTPDDLIVAADRALYRAKAEGRNRVGVGSQLGQMTA